MKIVRIIARLNVGGPTRHVVWLTEALQDKEFESVLLAGTVPIGEEDMSYFAEEYGVYPTFIEEMSRELSLKDVISLWKVYQRILKEKPDIIHTHTAKAGTIGRVAGFIYRWFTPKILIGKPRLVKLVHTYHGHVFHSYYGNVKTKLFLFIERTLARFATDKIVVISNQQKNEIHGDFKVGKENQFKIIPLGIDLSLFKRSEEKREILRNEVGVKKQEFLIGIVGRLTEVKNHKLFLQVVKSFVHKNNADVFNVKFVVIGDGNLREVLEAQAKELEIEDFVIFVGNRNDLDTCYAGLDAVALTSLNEGTPLSLIEAMINEKPVISTSAGGVVDLLGSVIEEQKGFSICERGVRVSSFDPKDFCEGLDRLINDRKLQTDLSKNGKGFVMAHYSKERLVEDVSSFYRELVKV